MWRPSLSFISKKRVGEIMGICEMMGYREGRRSEQGT